MKKKKKNHPVTTEEGSFVKYNRLLAIAMVNGRVDGEFPCAVCGMRYLSFDEASQCCKITDGYDPGIIIAKPSEPIMVSPKAMRIQFELDRMMNDLLDAIRPDESHPGQPIERDPASDRLQFLDLLDALLIKAGGSSPNVYLQARAAGLEMRANIWGKLINRLRRLGVLIPIPVIEDQPVEDDAETITVPDEE